MRRATSEEGRERGCVSRVGAVLMKVRKGLHSVDTHRLGARLSARWDRIVLSRTYALGVIIDAAAATTAAKMNDLVAPPRRVDACAPLSSSVTSTRG